MTNELMNNNNDNGSNQEELYQQDEEIKDLKFQNKQMIEMINNCKERINELENQINTNNNGDDDNNGNSEVYLYK